MKLSVSINGAEQTIDILAPAPDIRFRLGSEGERCAQVERPQPGVYSVLLDGRSYDAWVEQTASGITIVVIDGHRFEIEVRDPRRRARGAGAKGAEGVQSLTAPMPGKVVRVLAAAGDTVEAGQGIVVVEAMKMQNEIKALRAGRVLAVPAKEGASVAAGEVLARIE
jgi:biotin carboxyl carrier protein